MFKQRDDLTKSSSGLCILINFKNDQAEIFKCIESLIHQTFTDIEIFCVDNKSTDATGSVIKSFQDARIHTLDSPKDLLRHITKKYILPIKPSYCLSPKALEYIYNGIIKNKEMSPNSIAESRLFLKTDSLLLSNHKRKGFKKVTYCQPKLFCINDSEFGTTEDRLHAKEFLMKKFFQKSKFEI